MQKKQKENIMKIWIENKLYETHCILIVVAKKIRRIVGRLNSKRIDTTSNNGIIKIYPWQLRLFKCVTPDDFYIVTGIYDALIKTKICEGYRNFGFNYNTYKKILHILRCNYKWNEETQWENIKSIDFTWALGSTPMSIKGLKDWIVVWDSNEVKGEIDGVID